MAVLRYVCSGSFTRSEMYRDVVGLGNTAGHEKEKKGSMQRILSWAAPAFGKDTSSLFARRESL